MRGIDSFNLIHEQSYHLPLTTSCLAGLVCPHLWFVMQTINYRLSMIPDRMYKCRVCMVHSLLSHEPETEPAPDVLTHVNAA